MNIRQHPLILTTYLVSAIGLSACGGPEGLDATGTSEILTSTQNLKVLFVRLADFDGANASTLTEAQAEAALASSSDVFMRNGGNIQFVLDPLSDFNGNVHDTVMNHDCLLAPGATEQSIAAHTNKDVNGDGKVDGDDYNALCDFQVVRAARTAYALKHPNSIVVFSRGSTEYIKWVGTDSPPHYALAYASGGHSGASLMYVAMPKSFGGGDLLPHELGHYFHLAHTFGRRTASSLADAQAQMTAWGIAHPGDDLRNAFDGDADTSPHVYDTPADAAGAIFMEYFGTKCDPYLGSVPFLVPVNGQIFPVSISPDRANIMSYFKGCPWDFHFSPGQIVHIHDALLNGNRSSLLTKFSTPNRGKNCFATVKYDDKRGWPQGLKLVNQAIANCFILSRNPLPGEIYFGIYSNPFDASRGMVPSSTRADLYVDLVEEAALIQSQVNSEIQYEM